MRAFYTGSGASPKLFDSIPDLRFFFRHTPLVRSAGMDRFFAVKRFLKIAHGSDLCFFSAMLLLYEFKMREEPLCGPQRPLNI